MTTFKPSNTEVAEIAARALGDIQEPSEGRGLRLHLISSKRSTNGKTVCRLWHPDGHIVGSAGGWGYDRAATALGNALEVLIQPDLRAANDLAYIGINGIRPYWAGMLRWHPAKAADLGGPNGLGRVSVDGGMGMRTLQEMLGTVGLEVERFDTSDHSQIVFIRRVR